MKNAYLTKMQEPTKISNCEDEADAEIASVEWTYMYLILIFLTESEIFGE